MLDINILSNKILFWSENMMSIEGLERLITLFIFSISVPVIQ